MQIIKEKPFSFPDESFKFFENHFNELGMVRYIILYYAEREWLVSHSSFHKYVILVGIPAQLWLSGLSWGYYGSGPHTLFELMKKIDINISYDQVVNLEWMANYPIMFENVKGSLLLKTFNNQAKEMINLNNNHLPWEEGVVT